MFEKMRAKYKGADYVKLQEKKFTWEAEEQKEILDLWYRFISLFPEDDKLFWYWFKNENKKYALPYYYESVSNDLNISLDIQRRIIKWII